MEIQCFAKILYLKDSSMAGNAQVVYMYPVTKNSIIIVIVINEFIETQMGCDWFVVYDIFHTKNIYLMVAKSSSRVYAQKLTEKFVCLVCEQDGYF